MFYYDPIEEFGFGGCQLDILNSYGDNGGDIVVVGPSYGSPGFLFGAVGESGFGQWYFMFDQIPTDFVFQTPLDLEGRDCPVDRAAAEEALAILANSATARELLATAQSRDVGLELIVAGSRDGEEQTRYYHTSDTITWDPFQSVWGLNQDGSMYELSPVMTLAHELAHAAFDHAPTTDSERIAVETVAMNIANQIAREINAALGTTFDTSRDNHSSRGSFVVSSVSGVSETHFRLTRPGCS
jgi:Effector protein